MTYQRYRLCGDGYCSWITDGPDDTVIAIWTAGDDHFDWPKIDNMVLIANINIQHELELLRLKRLVGEIE